CSGSLGLLPHAHAASAPTRPVPTSAPTRPATNSDQATTSALSPRPTTAPSVPDKKNRTPDLSSKARTSELGNKTQPQKIRQPSSSRFQDLWSKQTRALVGKTKQQTELYGIRVLTSLLALAAILALIYVVVRWLSKRMGLPFSQTNPALSIQARMPLEPKKTLWIVRAAEQDFLLGSHEQGIVLLAKLDPRDQESPMPKSFEIVSTGQNTNPPQIHTRPIKESHDTENPTTTTTPSSEVKSSSIPRPEKERE
ncbi:MAG: flagellar biosynthetic protein FliO, partial [Myxococcota bacterium]